MFENNQPSVAVLLPCFNEEVTIGKVVRDFKAALPDATVYGTTTTPPTAPPRSPQPRAPSFAASPARARAT